MPGGVSCWVVPIRILLPEKRWTSYVFYQIKALFNHTEQHIDMPQPYEMISRNIDRQTCAYWCLMGEKCELAMLQPLYHLLLFSDKW